MKAKTFLTDYSLISLPAKIIQKMQQQLITFLKLSLPSQIQWSIQNTMRKVMKCVTLTVPCSVKMSINKNQTPLNELAFHSGVEDKFQSLSGTEIENMKGGAMQAQPILWLENCGINFIHCLLGKLLARGLPLILPHHLDDLFQMQSWMSCK